MHHHCYHTLVVILLVPQAVRQLSNVKDIQCSHVLLQKHNISSIMLWSPYTLPIAKRAQCKQGHHSHKATGLHCFGHGTQAGSSGTQWLKMRNASGGIASRLCGHATLMTTSLRTCASLDNCGKEACRQVIIGRGESSLNLQERKAIEIKIGVKQGQRQQQGNFQARRCCT